MTVWIFYFVNANMRRVIMTKRVVIYARVSTNEQNCDRQVAELEQVVKNNNWELVDTYIDKGYSRTTTTRPELDRMMKDSFVRKFEMVITLELSRLGSSLKHMIEVVDMFKGIIVCGKYDKKLDYARRRVRDVEVFLYQVNFNLREYKK
jgi:predicted site-specific integrase-resolvase